MGGVCYEAICNGNCNLSKSFFLYVPSFISLANINIYSGMCGACRLTVGGKTKFACVDGPDFNAHEIDFDEVINRTKIYKEEERKRSENCNLLAMASK